MSFNDVISFIKLHWLSFTLLALLILVVLVIIDIIVAKKNGSKPLNLLDTIVKYALTLIPGLIKAVECPGQGSLKKNYVLRELQLLLFKKFGFKEFEKLEPLFSQYIEDVLKTPQSHNEEE